VRCGRRGLERLRDRGRGSAVGRAAWWRTRASVPRQRRERRPYEDDRSSQIRHAYGLTAGPVTVNCAPARLWRWRWKETAGGRSLQSGWIGVGHGHAHGHVYGESQKKEAPAPG